MLAFELGTVINIVGRLGIVTPDDSQPAYVNRTDQLWFHIKDHYVPLGRALDTIFSQTEDSRLAPYVGDRFIFQRVREAGNEHVVAWAPIEEFTQWPAGFWRVRYTFEDGPDYTPIETVWQGTNLRDLAQSYPGFFDDPSDPVTVIYIKAKLGQNHIYYLEQLRADGTWSSRFSAVQHPATKLLHFA